MCEVVFKHNRIFHNLSMSQEAENNWRRWGGLSVFLPRGQKSSRAEPFAVGLRKLWAPQAPACSCEAACSVHRGQPEDVRCLHCGAALLPKGTTQTSQSPGQRKNGISGFFRPAPLWILLWPRTWMFLYSGGSLLAFPHFGSACTELFDTVKCKILQGSIQMLKEEQHGI